MLAAIFVVVGLYGIVHPTDWLMIHPGSPTSKGLPAMPARAEHVSKQGSQVHGLLSLAMGIGIGWVTLRYGRR
ncbi:MAG TPA: hypothetical protein VJY35_08015 [Candidatus Eisenbacteria bacterium]|nr:hypothetical protein [Candidatus Eisenbacteria bacterium]